MGLFVWALRLATSKGHKRDRSCSGIGFYANPMMSMLEVQKLCLVVAGMDVSSDAKRDSARS
jgi:hypothetical protein